MRASCVVVLGMVAATGCAPLFQEASPAEAPGRDAPGALYRAPGQHAAQDGMYGTGTPAEAPAPAANPPAPAVIEVRGAAVAVREPGIIILRTPDCCSGPLVITVACGRGGDALDEDTPPPAPYKPYEGSPRPRLYHDR